MTAAALERADDSFWWPGIADQTGWLSNDYVWEEEANTRCVCTTRRVCLSNLSQIRASFTLLGRRGLSDTLYYYKPSLESSSQSNSAEDERDGGKNRSPLSIDRKDRPVIL